MYVLSADTSAKTASVCVSRYDNGELMPLAVTSVNATLTHSESLLPMIDFCIKNASLSFADVDACAISTGPGSFTGVRIGVSTFKGLCFSRQDMPCVGVSTLHALAYNLSSAPVGTLIFPVMDARRHQFYNAAFSVGRTGDIKRLCADRLFSFEELLDDLKTHYPNRRILLAGDGASLFYSLYQKQKEPPLSLSLCDAGQRYQNAYSVARCALPLLTDADVCGKYPSQSLSPLYLRASQAERERESKLAEGSL